MNRISDHRGQHAALAFGHRPDGLGLWHSDARQELAAPRRSPATLACEKLGDRHARRLPGALQNDLIDGDRSYADIALELSAREAYLVGALKSLHMLRRRRGHRRCCVVHESSLAAPI